MTKPDETKKTDKAEEKKAPTVAKYEGGGYLPGVPARDLTDDDLKEMDEHTMERLRQDAERETPMYKFKSPLGHSELYKAEQERTKKEKADAANSEKES
jgi:hypothetical protein